MEFILGALWFLYQTVVHILAIVGSIDGFIIWEQGRY